MHPGATPILIGTCCGTPVIVMERRTWSWRANPGDSCMHICRTGVFALYGLYAGDVATTHAPPAMRARMSTTMITFRGRLALKLRGGGGRTVCVAFRSASSTISGFASRGWTDCRCFERFSVRTEAPHTGHLGDAIGTTTTTGDIEVSEGMTACAPSARPMEVRDASQYS